MGENGSAFRHPVNMITRSDLRWARTVETISEFFLAVSSFLRWFFFLPFVEKKRSNRKKNAKEILRRLVMDRWRASFVSFFCFPVFFYIFLFFVLSLFLSDYIVVLSIFFSP